MAYKQISALQVAAKVGSIPTPTITPEGTAGTSHYSYKLVGVDALGNQSAAGSAGSTTTGAATLTGTNFNTLTWTDPAGAVTILIYRTATNGTPATTGLIGSVAAGVQTFNDTGLAGDSSTPSATDGTGVGPSISIAAWQEFSVFMTGLTGTWHIEISSDNVNFFMSGTAQTNAGFVTCIDQGAFMRVVISAFTSGTYTAKVVGLYSHDGG